MSLVRCPRCYGKKRVLGGYSEDGGHYLPYPCGLCLTTGTVDSVRAEAGKFGRHLHALRLSHGKSLGEYARHLGITTVALSRIEIGLPA